MSQAMQIATTAPVASQPVAKPPPKEIPGSDPLPQPQTTASGEASPPRPVRPGTHVDIRV